MKIDGIKEKNNFGAYGLFVNGKIGYKFLYLLPAITMYYQNYGTYQFLEGRQFSFSGMTFIPSIGVQAIFGAGQNKGR